ncbi:MAG: type I-E CRISPR-associated endoribonuclease Cas2e [Bacillota bacterium]|nr:type I-E CRISPR-associated endoribonuclease Cas2e [Bacillota bacterium]
MVVMILENVPASIKGELTRWLLEVKTGVFVSVMNKTVRDLLWWKIKTDCRQGGAILIYNSDNEQEYDMDIHGLFSKSIVDYEGINLIQTSK